MLGYLLHELQLWEHSTVQQPARQHGPTPLLKSNSTPRLQTTRNLPLSSHYIPSRRRILV